MLRNAGVIVLALAVLTGVGRPAPASIGGCIESPVPRPGDGPRTIEHDDPVIRQALRLLGQPVNPVKLVGTQELRAIYRGWGSFLQPPRGLVAVRGADRACNPHIYVNRDARVYQAAVAKPSPINLLKLAATLAHEQVHNSDGEYAAYRLQSDFVRSRVGGLPWRYRDEAGRYLRELDERARAFARTERLAGRSGGRRRVEADASSW